MKKFITKIKFEYILGIVLFLTIWFLISFIVDEKTMIFPDPISTFKETFRILKTNYVYKCLSESLIRLIIGFGISFILALVFGIIAKD